MSLLSALRHAASKPEEPYNEYQDEPTELIVDSITVMVGDMHRDIKPLIKAGWERELRGIKADRDRWKEKAVINDDLLREIRLLRADVALLQKSMPRPNTPTPPAP